MAPTPVLADDGTIVHKTVVRRTSSGKAKRRHPAKHATKHASPPKHGRDSDVNPGERDKLRVAPLGTLSPRVTTDIDTLVDEYLRLEH